MRPALRDSDRRAPAAVVLALSLILATLCNVPSHATTMLVSSIEQLATRSDLVVRGHTLSVQSAWDQGRIVTIARMHVVETLRGVPTGDPIEVVTLGGSMGGTRMVVVGGPTFDLGEDVVLFLSRREDGRYGVVDLGQGKFEIHRDAAGREQLARRAFHGVTFLGPGVPPGPQALAELSRRVREAR